MIKAHNLDPTLRSRILNVGGYPRRQWHVCKETAENAGYLYDNLERGQLFHTINEAVAQCQAYEDVIVWPGQYKETTTIALAADSMRLLAAEMGPNKALTRTEIRQHGNSEIDCISVEGAHNIEVAGFRITPYTSAAGIGVRIGETANTYGTYIHDNYFYAVQTSKMCTHIKYGYSTTYNADSTCIINNHFLAGGAHGAGSTTHTIEHVLGSFSLIQGNSFICYGNTTDSKTIEVSGTVERLQILDNKFLAFEVGGVLCIDVGNKTDGHCWIDGNNFVGFTANANCFDYCSDNGGINWLNYAVIDD